MSGSSDKFDELGELTAVLCDGQVTPEQAARLEQLANRCDEARRYFLHYVQLHGELYWDNATGVAREPLAGLEQLLATQPAGAELPRSAKPVRRTAAPIVLMLTAVAAAALVVVMGWWSVPESHDRASVPPIDPAREFVARLSGAADAAWSDDDTPGSNGGLPSY